MKSTLSIVLLACSLLLLSLTNVALAGQWAGSVKYTRQTLTYTASTSLLGHATPFAVVFGCDPTTDKESSGTLGFDIEIKNASKLKAFPFGDFEGPDASAAADVRLTLTRKDKPVLTFKTTASGSHSEENTFCFGVSEVSKKSKSVPRSLLQALAENDAEELRITIADPRNKAVELVFSVPVAGRQAEFRTLLTGLK